MLIYVVITIAHRDWNHSSCNELINLYIIRPVMWNVVTCTISWVIRNCVGFNHVPNYYKHNVLLNPHNHYNHIVSFRSHYVIMNAMASQITGVSIVCSTVCSGADQKEHQSSVSMAVVMGIHQWQVDTPHKRPVTRKMFPFDDVIMKLSDNILLTFR